MFGRNTKQPVDALEAASAASLNALSLFTEARSGLESANQTLSGVIEDAVTEIESLRERANVAQDAKNKNSRVIGALDNFVGL